MVCIVCMPPPRWYGSLACLLRDGVESAAFFPFPPSLRWKTRPSSPFLRRQYFLKIPQVKTAREKIDMIINPLIQPLAARDVDVERLDQWNV